MKIYYSGELLPIGYRKETDEEFKIRIKEHLNSNPVKQEDEQNDEQNIDNFLRPFGVCRSLIPLKDDEKVILRTFTGEMEMSEALKQLGLA